jgi:hypothetical protein
MQDPQTYLCAFSAKLFRPALLCFGALCFSACTGSRQQTDNVSVPTQTNTTQTTTTQTTTTQSTATPQPTPTASPAPTASATPTAIQPAEAEAKLAHIFQGAVQFDQSQRQNAIVGDFNGDGSEDIAIVVRPAADKLADINSEVANWILEDPHFVAVPDPDKAIQKLPAPAEPVKVQPTDLLLTIIHGYKETGWRNPDAQQTYLLKNAVGRGLRMESRQEALSTYKTLAPHLRGDIVDQELSGAHGCLYWTGAKYVWFPLPKAKT